MQPGDSLQLPFEERRILSVANLNRDARRIVETGLGTVWVEGEISNLSRPSSGHLYWSLKDAQAQIQQLNEKISSLRGEIEKRTANLGSLTTAAMTRKTDVQKVLDFFAAPAAPVP